MKKSILVVTLLVSFNSFGNDSVCESYDTSAIEKNQRLSLTSIIGSARRSAKVTYAPKDIEYKYSSILDILDQMENLRDGIKALTPNKVESYSSLKLTQGEEEYFYFIQKEVKLMYKIEEFRKASCWAKLKLEDEEQENRFKEVYKWARSTKIAILIDYTSNEWDVIFIPASVTRTYKIVPMVVGPEKYKVLKKSKYFTSN